MSKFIFPVSIFSLMLGIKNIILLFILTLGISITTPINVIAEKRDPAEVVKIITVKIYDNYF